MKVTKEKAAEHRANVVQAASKLFREHGFNGINIAELTAAACLTHGGFYRQFDSKEELFAEATEAALVEVIALFTQITSNANGMGHFAKGYLADENIHFCPVVNLGADVSRQEPEIQERFASGLRQLLAVRGSAMSSDAWNKYTAAFATLFGTLLMAKAVRLADKTLADAITNAGLEQFETVQEPGKTEVPASSNGSLF
ncbi:MAG: TetR/AcrR family transcriptional regulator [Rhizonema sp. PD38]|nr:TetR/AcrR family transcriptional regulator [Rhizonema sp. PD38]